MANTLPRRNLDLKIFETIFRLPLPLQRESSLFLIASVLDVLMTCMLLEDLTGVTGRTIFYESNPVARYFFQGWGLAGIVYFKFFMVGFIEVICPRHCSQERGDWPPPLGLRNARRFGRGRLQHVPLDVASLGGDRQACFPAHWVSANLRLMAGELPDALRRELTRHGQEHVLQLWDTLSPAPRQRLLEQLRALDLAELESLVAACRRTGAAQQDALVERSRCALPPQSMVRLPQTADEHDRWQQARRGGPTAAVRQGRCNSRGWRAGDPSWFRQTERHVSHRSAQPGAAVPDPRRSSFWPARVGPASRFPISS